MDEFSVSNNEFITACKTENIENELIRGYNTYSDGEEIQSLQELDNDSMSRLMQEVIPSQEYSLMMRILRDRDGVYVCDIGDNVSPHRFAQIDDSMVNK